MSTTFARLQLNRKTSAEWVAQNPILLHAEPAVETDTLKFKIGDGTRAWNDLPYTSGEADLSNYYTKEEIQTILSELSIPTKVSQLENDSHFVTNSELPAVPTKVSELENDSNFINKVKTINGQSIVGEGNIDIQGGGETKEQVPAAAIKITYQTTMDREGELFGEDFDTSKISKMWVNGVLQDTIPTKWAMKQYEPTEFAYLLAKDGWSVDFPKGLLSGQVSMYLISLDFGSERITIGDGSLDSQCRATGGNVIITFPDTIYFNEDEYITNNRYLANAYVFRCMPPSKLINIGTSSIDDYFQFISIESGLGTTDNDWIASQSANNKCCPIFYSKQTYDILLAQKASGNNNFFTNWLANAKVLDGYGKDGYPIPLAPQHPFYTLRAENVGTGWQEGLIKINDKSYVEQRDSIMTLRVTSEYMEAAGGWHENQRIAINANGSHAFKKSWQYTPEGMIKGGDTITCKLVAFREESEYWFWEILSVISLNNDDGGVVNVKEHKKIEYIIDNESEVPKEQIKLFEANPDNYHYIYGLTFDDIMPSRMWIDGVEYTPSEICPVELNNKYHTVTLEVNKALPKFKFEPFGFYGIKCISMTLPKVFYPMPLWAFENVYSNLDVRGGYGSTLNGIPKIFDNYRPISVKVDAWDSWNQTMSELNLHTLIITEFTKGVFNKGWNFYETSIENLVCEAYTMPDISAELFTECVEIKNIYVRPEFKSAWQAAIDNLEILPSAGKPTVKALYGYDNNRVPLGE